MCGIAGLWRPGGWSGGDRSALQAMCDAIRHRGPDAEGSWVDAAAGIGLGHRRLAIIDVSPTGAQPMRSHDGRWTLTFNGEVYNFRELRTELVASGVQFRGSSDTEVLVEGFARWGVRPTLDRAAGMFALALWDAQSRTLTLARDRLGEKPLHYGHFGGAFAFSSELKAFRSAGLLEGRSLDRLAMAQMLRYACIPAPRTIYEGVAKLPPASLATIGADGSVAVESYWSVTQVAARAREVTRPPEPPQEGAARLEAQLLRSVADQMASDVPLGALLSGGIDSSLVVALMRRQSPQPVPTFTIGFRDPAYDEAEFARNVARHLGTEHHELYVSPEDARAVIPDLTAIYDEPFGDISQIPTLLVSRLARAHVTVALTGEGGDETFGGYGKYFNGDRLWRRVAGMPLPLRRIAGRLIRGVPVGGWDAVAPLALRALGRGAKAGRFGSRAHKVGHLLGATSRADLFERFSSQWPETPSLVSGVPSAARDLPQFAAPGGSPYAFVEEMMLADTVTYLPDDVLVKIDRAAMSASLETRAPLLDHRLVEVAWSLPLAQKVSGGSSKRVLRELLFKYVPRELVDRPKMGFEVPIEGWLRGPLREWGEDLLSESRLRSQGLLHVAPVRRAWQEHLSGRANLHYALWNALMLQSWLGG